MKNHTIFRAIAAGLLFLFPLLLNANAEEPDWSKIAETNMILFYPAQTSWKYLTSEWHPGSIALKENKAGCTDCHEGQIADLAIKSISNREPTPIAGKEPLKVVSIKAAYDKAFAYFWFQWVSAEPGIYRKYQVFDGKQWKPEGAVDRPYNLKKGVPAQYEDRLSVMLGDERVPSFPTSGCFITCHSDMRNMPNEAKAGDVKAHPVLGEKGMKKSDIRKYISESRTELAETGGWSHVRSKDELEKSQNQGKFLDLLQWRASRGNPIGILDDGYVLEYRNFDSDGKFMEDNFDKDKKQPKYMYDEKKTGMKAFTYDQLRQQKYYYISEDIAVPFDPDAGWKKGDAIADPVIFTPEDNTSSVRGDWKDGKWTVVIKKKLNHGKPTEDKMLILGKQYTMGISIHDDNTTQRHHYVSFPLTVGFDSASADINIVWTE